MNNNISAKETWIEELQRTYLSNFERDAKFFWSHVDKSLSEPIAPGLNLNYSKANG